MLNYSHIFTLLGRCVFWTNTLVNDQNTLFLASTTGEADNLQAAFNADRDLCANFENQVAGQVSAMAGWVTPLTQIANNVLGSLQAALNAPDSTPGTIIPLLYSQMVADGQSIQSTIISTPVVTPAGTNVGDGLLKVSTINALGITDERIIDQTVQLICTQSQWSGGTAGAETFSINGFPTPTSVNLYGPQGNGQGNTITVADARNFIQNGNFETWAGSPNNPTGWTVVAGVEPTNIAQETILVHTGTSALKFIGDGATTTIELNQLNTAFNTPVNSSTVYGVGVWLRKNGTVMGGSTFTVSLKGTGVATQTLFSADPVTLTTNYVLHWTFFSSGLTVPPVDYQIDLKWTAANAAGASAIILIDDVVLVTPTAYGFAQYVIFRGGSDFAVTDNISVATAVYSAGVFSAWFSRFESAILPSSGSPSISDALAE